MLDRLYTLYVTVITTIKGYGDYFWADVVEKVDEMGEQVGGVRGEGWCGLVELAGAIVEGKVLLLTANGQ